MILPTFLGDPQQTPGSFRATGAVTVDGETVTVGLGEGNPRAREGLLNGNAVLYLRRADGSGGPMRDLAGNPVTTPDVWIGGDSARRGEWRYVLVTLENVTRGTGVTGVDVVSDAGADDTYALGERVRVAVTFSEAVAVDTAGGTPGLSIDMNPAAWGEKRAAYESGSGTATLVFAHEVVEPNLSTPGVAVLANTLALGGGTIKSVETQEDAGLGHAGLAHDPAHKVDWRPAVSVADAKAREGVDEAVAFEVSLDRAFTGAEHQVTVDYATADGTAKAGEDYTATSGTLTFAAGERVKTVSVPIHDDGHDEGHETFAFRLSNVEGARMGDGETTGTIENTDPMPKAWLARFGRTVAEQVVDAVGARLDAPRTGGGQATLGGQALPSWTGGTGPGQAPGSGSGAGAGTSGAAAAGFGDEEAARREAERLAQWLAGTGERDADVRAESRDMTGREALAATAFSLTVAPEAGGPSVALWGRGASSSFSGREGALSLDGEVTSATLGAKGALVEPAGGSGLRLDLEADVLWVRTSSDAAPGLAAAEADVTRLRLGLDGGYPVTLAGGGTLEPTFELGLRHDGGDAETGYGIDLGGGVGWTNPALGLSAEVRGRGLLAHEASGLKDRGVSGSFAWDPAPGSDRGPSLTLTQTLGAQAAGGADALLGRKTLADLAANDGGLESRRLELKLGYGVAAFGGRFTATPELGLGLADTGREVRLG